MTVGRMIYSSDVRQMCIDNDYYTRGDICAYDRMLKAVEEIDPDDPKQMETIATDILDHSDIRRMQDTYNANYIECLRSVMYNLYNDCCRTIVLEEEE